MVLCNFNAEIVQLFVLNARVFERAGLRGDLAEFILQLLEKSVLPELRSGTLEVIDVRRGDALQLTVFEPHPNAAVDDGLLTSI